MGLLGIVEATIEDLAFWNNGNKDAAVFAAGFILGDYSLK
jgi:hypothetical protein